MGLLEFLFRDILKVFWNSFLNFGTKCMLLWCFVLLSLKRDQLFSNKRVWLLLTSKGRTAQKICSLFRNTADVWQSGWKWFYWECRIIHWTSGCDVFCCEGSDCSHVNLHLSFTSEWAVARMLLGIVIYTLLGHRFPLMDKQSSNFALLWGGLAFVNHDETVTVTQSITAQKKRRQNQIINIHTRFLHQCELLGIIRTL